MTPEEAQKLALAMQVGSLSLALRNTDAVKPVPVSTIGIEQLVGRETRAASKTNRDPAVRVRRGVGDISLTPVAR